MLYTVVIPSFQQRTVYYIAAKHGLKQVEV